MNAHVPDRSVTGTTIELAFRRPPRRELRQEAVATFATRYPFAAAAVVEEPRSRLVSHRPCVGAGSLLRFSQIGRCVRAYRGLRWCESGRGRSCADRPITTSPPRGVRDEHDRGGGAGADFNRCRESSRGLGSGNVMTDAYVTSGGSPASGAGRWSKSWPSARSAGSTRIYSEAPSRPACRPHP